MQSIRADFMRTADGLGAIAARTAFVDELVLRLWSAEVVKNPKLATGVALGAVGGYGRSQLFPHSDVDLLFLVEKADAGRESIRFMSQALWDCGLKIALSSRLTGDCERFEATNPEFGLSLLDFRPLGGDPKLLARMAERCLPRLRKHEKSILAELGRLTRERHSKYGNTLFHLEPNIKDCPGGLRDANTAEWLRNLVAARTSNTLASDADEVQEAFQFLASVRVFLHFRHERDDNTLEWRSQEAAAEQGIGLSTGPDRRRVDGAYWMRAYFRNARVVERCLLREAELAGLRLGSSNQPRSLKLPSGAGFRLRDRKLELVERLPSGADPAHEPEVVLAAYAASAASGSPLTPETEERIGDAIPLLSAHLEEGPTLWRALSRILTGDFAADALRSMHAVGVLELILPEFHGIDALVIRDAYHRYTVDEHTFVLIETLHGLEQPAPAGSPDWRVKFGSMIRELQNPGLLYLAALLHDTGKGRVSDDHAAESARMTQSVLARMEMDSYDAGLVLGLIENHLEMSAALRRDIFDAETVRAFASKVQTQEALRMLTLFTYADIAAVHPDALTPWKAENLWRLSMSTANQLDRSVDEERVHAREGAAEVRVAGMRRRDGRVARFLELAGDLREAAASFLEGFPERYLETRAPEVIYKHFEMTRNFAVESFQIALKHSENVSEITLVTQDRPRLFAGMAAALAAWGMNVVTADAFANDLGVVVDSFRFTDTFRTLELNESEHHRFLSSVRDLIAGRTSVEGLLSSRRRAKPLPPKVVVDTRIEFDDTASSHATLLQIVSQDLPGLLRAVSDAISAASLNVEVALIDTEGEVAIDVFYLSFDGRHLPEEQKSALRTALEEAIEANAR